MRSISSTMRPTYISTLFHQAARRSVFCGLVLLLGSLLASTNTAWGQATTSLRGTITDPSGAAVAGATVTITGEESKVERTASTGPAGEYQFLFLPPGTYTLTASASGFQRYELKGLGLLVNTPATATCSSR